MGWLPWFYFSVNEITCWTMSCSPAHASWEIGEAFLKGSKTKAFLNWKEIPAYKLKNYTHTVIYLAVLCSVVLQWKKCSKVSPLCNDTAVQFRWVRSCNMTRSLWCWQHELRFTATRWEPNNLVWRVLKWHVRLQAPLMLAFNSSARCMQMRSNGSRRQKVKRWVRKKPFVSLVRILL